MNAEFDSTKKRQPKRDIEDVVSELLSSPVAKNLGPRHIHVWRKEYPKCMLKGCGAKKKDYYA